MKHRGVRFLIRWAVWVAVAGIALQGVFLGRIALMAVSNPASTTFQRSEAWQLARSERGLRWAHEWVSYPNISVHLKRAVIASEDAGFATHRGVDWEAIQTARMRNERREARAQARGTTARPIGGSTITQQLAKNLLLSGERLLWRKGQELVLALMLEGLLSKERILEIYLNHVEWGEGIFGAEAASQQYFRKPAARLNAHEAARLAVMLPAPKRYQRNPYSGYLNQRTHTIVARMPAVQLP